MQIGTEDLIGVIMSDEIHLREVIDLQREFSGRLRTVIDRPQHTIVPRLLQNILQCDDEIIDLSLGQLGQKLKRFAKEIDFSHPDLVRIFDGAFAENSLFSQECGELLILGEYARSQSLHQVLPSLSKVITQDALHKHIFRRVDSPYNNRLHVRLLPDREGREEVRSMKRTQTLSMEAVYRRGEDFWCSQPISFRRFLRFDLAYEEEIKRAKAKAGRYKELGCEILCEEIERSLVEFNQQVEDGYYGFNRITMTTAAVILAKSLGHKMGHARGSLYTAERRQQIEVDRSFFGDYNFDPHCKSPATFEDSMNFSRISHRGPFKYTPRVYPLHEFWSLAPPTVVETINHLEKFPEAGNKPIFDHFGVIVPSVEFLVQKDDEYVFLDEMGDEKVFPNIDDASKALDIILVENGYFHPVILGEKDNKCYFISYWA